MDPKSQSLRNKQKERQQRGKDFQDEVRRSWRLIPAIWRMRIKDSGTTAPADELIITENLNFLCEHKRTAKDSFQLDFLRPSQIQGLIDFDQVIKRNIGLVFVSFLNEGNKVDETYAIRLVEALKFMKYKDRTHIKLNELQELKSQVITRHPIGRYLPQVPRAAERTLNLKGVLNFAADIRNP